MSTVLYLHGKGGSAYESEHYKPLFPASTVIGFDYRSITPWEAKEEFPALLEKDPGNDKITLVANSIGAYFAMQAGIEAAIEKAYFISPMVDLEGLILGMMQTFHITENELKEKGVIKIPFGEDLSWNYLSYVRSHPIVWQTPTHILYGENDALTPYQTIQSFAKAHKATLTVMPGGEHWFHTEDEMRFLDDWIKEKEGAKR